MPRYHYTCLIKALYMMKEFGVKIKQLDNYPELPQGFVDISFEDMRDDILPYFNPRFEKENRLYVCEESEHIFEPKIKDFAKSLISDVVGEIFSKSPYESRVALAKIDEEEGFIYRDSEIQIIMRDNKQFFMPEVEND